MLKSTAFFVLVAALPAVFAQQPLYGQCGGQGWTGGTTCVAGATCTYANQWYSQCLPGSNPGTSNPPTSTSTRPPTSSTTTTTSSSSSAPTSTQPPGNLGAGIGQNAATSINAKFRSHGKLYYGTIVDPGTMSSSQATIKADFGAVTPENSMKWDSIESSQNNFNWNGPDQVVNFAQTNNLIARGHTFVWAQQTPGWVQNLNGAALTSALQNHIKTVMTRYKGKIYAYDVVNEHIDESGNVKSTFWTQKLGNDVFRIAFQAARDADPGAKLYINDYNLDSNNAKVAGIVRLVNSLNANGTLVDGIGSQAHITGGQGNSAQAALTALAAANRISEVAVTELDVAQAPSADYVAVAKACLAVPKCIGITVWGVRDQDSWRASTNPLLFNNSFQPKAAYNATLAAL